MRYCSLFPAGAIGRFLACAVFVAAGSGGVASQGRPNTPQMTCAAAQKLVLTHGAIVMGTGPSTYERFVRDLGQCTQNDSLHPQFAPTIDHPECGVGFICRDRQGKPK